MIVHSSHLALRFYLKDAWTREDLDPMVTKGKLVYMHDEKFNALSYYVLEPHGLFDIDKLCETATSVITWQNKVLLGEEMKQYFKEMSW